jgi:hypothetical protein
MFGKRRKTGRIEYVRVSKYETASLWMLGAPDDPSLKVVSLHCATCPDPDNSRLVHINVPTEPWHTRRENPRRKGKPPLRMLLHVTRAQIEQILEDFGKKNNGATLRAIFYHKDDSGERTDRM